MSVSLIKAVLWRTSVRPLVTISKNFSISKSLAYQQNTDPDAPTFDVENPFLKERRQCVLCRHGITPDYKNVQLLSQFQSPYTGRIYGKHITGLCTDKQTRVEAEIQKAQSAGLMGVYQKNPEYWADPKLYDSDNPIRAHRF